MKVRWDGYLWICYELLVGCIYVCSSGLFGRAPLILTDTTLSYFIWGKLAFHHNFDPVRGFFHFLTAIVHYHLAQGLTVRGYRYEPELYCSPWPFLILTTPSSFPSHMTLFLLSVHLSVSLSAVHFSLIMSHPPLITLSPRCECIYNVEHVHFMLISPTPSLPFSPPPPPNGYCDRPVCVCACACQTWAYGVPSCQHMPEGFSMPVLARTCMCVMPRPACCCLQR